MTEQQIPDRWYFDLTWCEWVKTDNDEKPRRILVAKRLEFDREAEAYSKRRWYEEHPESWVPDHGGDPEVSRVALVRRHDVPFRAERAARVEPPTSAA